MKRLLCIISRMDAGGAETFLMKIYRKLDKSLYQMDFCVQVKEEGFYDKEIKANGGRIFYITSKSENVKQFKKELFNLVKKENYQYVMRITANAFGLLDLKIAKKAGAKRCIARSSNSASQGGIKSALAHVYGRLFFDRFVDAKIAPSDLSAIYTFGKKAYKSGKVAILNNGIDLGVYAFDKEAGNAVRKEFDLENKFVVGHIGRFNAQKNHEFLLKVFAEIKKLRPDSMLLLVGKGELEQTVKAQAEALGISDSLIFAGVRSDVPALLSAMDAFVFPSFYEGMPNTLIEAQATGLSCIVADTITKEANLTGKVKYLSLSDSPETWAKETISFEKNDRADVSDLFKEKGYDINSVVEKFTELVFEKDNK